MTVRAMWKGVLRIGERSVPVKLYAALESSRVGFRLLDAGQEAPVRQEMVDRSTDEPVQSEEIRKGFQVDDGVFAILSPDDLASLEPPPSRDIGLSRFVPLAAVDDRWYDRAYWLGPDGDEAAYSALVEALRDTGREGIAHWVMRKKRYHGSLRVRGDHLVLIRLRHAEEVVPVSALPAVQGREPDEREIRLARQLVGALEGTFDPEDFPETWSDRVRELVEAKAAGRVVKLQTPRRPTEEPSLADALEQSLAATGGGRG